MDPAEALFTKYQRVVLGLLLLRPDERFHVRELARITGFPAGTLSRQLKHLAAAGILEVTRQGNQVSYQANRACPVFAELSGLFRKTSGLVYPIRDALAPRWDEINLALVFGSVAKGAAKPHSDLDILIVGNLGLRELVKLVSPLGESLGREINPVLMTKKKFTAGLANKDRLLERIKDEPKLFVKGAQDDFEELGGIGQT